MNEEGIIVSNVAEIDEIAIDETAIKAVKKSTVLFISWEYHTIS